jgi:hypothetical protein
MRLLAIGLACALPVTHAAARVVPSLGDNIMTARLTGVVYHDANGDGGYTTNEGMAGVSTIVRHGKAAGALCTVTAADGSYSVPLAEGVYQVCFSSPAFPHPFIYEGVTVRAARVELRHRVPPKWPVPDAPEGMDASDGIYDGTVVLSWNATHYAARYRVWRSEQAPHRSDDSPTWSTDVYAATTFADATVVAGTTYAYWVQAGNTSGWSHTSVADHGFALAHGSTCSVQVTSVNPAQGVAIQVARKDVQGLQHGATPFTRMYPEHRFVALRAPRLTHSNFFHHWEINLDTWRVSPRVRLRMEGALHAQAVYLDAAQCTVVKYTPHARNDFLILRDVQPALSNLFAAQVKRIGLLDAATHAIVDGPHALQERGHGMLYQYNGARAKAAVIRCYPRENLLVYLVWKKLPARVMVGAWIDEPAPASDGAGRSAP